MDATADALAHRLEPMIAIEHRAVNTDEVEAVVLAVQESLNTRGLDASLLARRDYDPALVEKWLREQHDERVARIGFSDAASRLYDDLLTETCTYIVAIASQLPGFESANAKELLSRESSILDLSERILAAIPTSSVPANWGHGDDNQRFETQYLRTIATNASTVSLFGVSSPAAKMSYELSLAYISLTISTTPLEEEESPGGQPDTVDTTKAETFLETHDRVLLSGDAGSGKTTLLQWMALRATRTIESPESKSPWAGKVPFTIPLRRFVDGDFPTPGQFTSIGAPNIAETEPHGWAHRILAEGRAVILIDGLDEIPQERRKQAFDWVKGLIADFPNNSLMVTSRGTAVTDEWAESDIFVHASLQAMEPSDIKAFVEHWHNAVRATVTRDRYSSIAEAQHAMLRIIRSTGNIRELCTSPLLCALMCSLHLENGASLPADRMSLYKTAIEMLLMARDNARGLARDSAETLTLRNREVLLQHFAAWLHDNGQANCSRADYEASITHTLQSLPRVTMTGSATAQFVLERCGVLREPTSGRVDFIHRSFLEYLAAAAIVAENSMHKLINNAHDDTWREVVIMAAGHANNSQRTTLLEGLLERGRSDESLRHRLFFLAVACMQTASELAPDLTRKLQDALNEVVPPSNMTEAAAVASAGTSAAHLLKYNPRRGVMDSVASVRALALIGGEEAFESMKTHTREKRLTVIRQIVRAWSSFDVEKYAQEVLRESTFIRGTYNITDLEQLPYVKHFTNLKVITIELDGSTSGWAALDSVSGDNRIREISISDASWVRSFEDMPSLPGLTKLNLGRSKLESLSGLEHAPALTELNIEDAPALTDLTGLLSLQALTSLSLGAPNVPDLGQLEHLSPILESLSIRDAGTLLSLSKLPSKRFTLYGHSAEGLDLTGLADEKHVENLTLWNMALPDELHIGPTVRTLNVYDGRGVPNIIGGDALSNFTIDCAVNEELAIRLRALPKLDTLVVDRGQEPELLREFARALSDKVTTLVHAAGAGVIPTDPIAIDDFEARIGIRRHIYTRKL
jgi:Leucine-rich repeat (LRR) protein